MEGHHEPCFTRRTPSRLALQKLRLDQGRRFWAIRSQEKSTWRESKGGDGRGPCVGRRRFLLDGHDQVIKRTAWRRLPDLVHLACSSGRLDTDDWHGLRHLRNRGECVHVQPQDSRVWVPQKSSTAAERISWHSPVAVRWKMGVRECQGLSRSVRGGLQHDHETRKFWSRHRNK